MKKLTLIKQAAFATLVMAGMNIFSSCESCSRKEAGPDQTTTDMNTDTDTTAYDDSAYDDGTASGMNDGTNTSRSIKAGSGSTTATTKPAATSSSTSASASGTKNNGLTEEQITNQIENSDAKSGTLDKNGKPIRSSGDAGTGQGTGTGSTGNNSRVTTKEAQKGN